MLRFSSLATRSARPHAPAIPLLNLGCGRRRHPAWTNADLVPSGPDVLAVDLRRPLPFAAASFTAVYAAHVVEHLDPTAAHTLLGEAARVLAPGGVVRIVVPDLEGIVRAYLTSLDAVSDGDGESRWRHRWMTVELLKALDSKSSVGLNQPWVLRPARHDRRRRPVDDETPAIGWRKERHGIGGSHRPLDSWALMMMAPMMRPAR